MLHPDPRIAQGAMTTLARLGVQVPGALLEMPGPQTVYIDVNPLATPPPDDHEEQSARLQAMPEYREQQEREAAARAQLPAGMTERAQDDPVDVPTPEQLYARRHGVPPPPTPEQRAAEQERLLARRMRDD
jgi:hypothetical protein